MRRGRRRKQNNRAGKICISCIVLMLLVVMTIQIAHLYEKNETYAAQEKGLNEQLEDETERQSQLSDYEAYTNSQEYIEDTAKNKLGLIKDNEIIFKESN